jgi:hypothetical protein
MKLFQALTTLSKHTVVDEDFIFVKFANTDDQEYQDARRYLHDLTAGNPEEFQNAIIKILELRTIEQEGE